MSESFKTILQVFSRKMKSSSSGSAATTAATGASGTAGRNWKQIGDEAWKRADKVNGELFALTYGCLVAQLLRDYEDPAQVNGQLEKMGYALGIRLVDELLARTPVGRCADFRETAEIVRLAFRLFLNLQPTITTASDREFVIHLGGGEAGGDGLGSEWVELPEAARKGGLHYASLLTGTIRGALEMVHMEVECTIVNDPLLQHGGANSPITTDIRVKLVRLLQETLPPA